MSRRQQIPVIFSDHALERMVERFAGRPEIPIPYDMIRAMGKHRKEEESYEVRSGPVTYRCCKTRKCILVITVIPRKAPRYIARKGKGTLREYRDSKRKNQSDQGIE